MSSASGDDKELTERLIFRPRDECNLFVSYKHSDSDLLKVFRAFVDLMSRKTLTPCRTVTDADITPGKRWRTEIINYIKQCDVFTVLVPYELSTEVALECGMALALDKPILPFVFPETVQTLATYGLDHLQAVLLKRGLPEAEREAFRNDIVAKIAQVIFHAKGWYMPNDYKGDDVLIPPLELAPKE